MEKTQLSYGTRERKKMCDWQEAEKGVTSEYGHEEYGGATKGKMTREQREEEEKERAILRGYFERIAENQKGFWWW